MNIMQSGRFIIQAATALLVERADAVNSHPEAELLHVPAPLLLSAVVTILVRGVVRVARVVRPVGGGGGTARAEHVAQLEHEHVDLLRAHVLVVRVAARRLLERKGLLGRLAARVLDELEGRVRSALHAVTPDDVVVVRVLGLHRDVDPRDVLRVRGDLRLQDLGVELAVAGEAGRLRDDLSGRYAHKHDTIQYSIR